MVKFVKYRKQTEHSILQSCLIFKKNLVQFSQNLYHVTERKD